MTRSLSTAGLEQLILEEGEVLRAYQDVKGVWTIGVGLTAASGVIRPVKGTVITRADSRALLARGITQLCAGGRLSARQQRASTGI